MECMPIREKIDVDDAMLQHGNVKASPQVETMHDVICAGISCSLMSCSPTEHISEYVLL